VFQPFDGGVWIAELIVDVLEEVQVENRMEQALDDDVDLKINIS
jgi:hypothetical protein